MTAPCDQQHHRLQRGLSVPDLLPVAFWIRFNRNVVARPFHSYSDTVDMRKRRRYGLQITSADLPVLVQLTPDQKHRRMDLDLYGYTGMLMVEGVIMSICGPNRL